MISYEDLCRLWRETETYENGQLRAGDDHRNTFGLACADLAVTRETLALRSSLSRRHDELAASLHADAVERVLDEAFSHDALAVERRVSPGEPPETYDAPPNPDDPHSEPRGAA